MIFYLFMYKTKFLFILFVVLSLFASAEDLQKYKMIDLGLFGTDESQALVVNEKGQVAGVLIEVSLFIFGMKLMV